MANVSGEHLGARVRFLETEVEGEKLVTRHILEQTRRNADDLAVPKIVTDALRAVRTRGRKS